MSQVRDNFLRYIAVDTQSDEDSATLPSTKKQFDLANILVSELSEMGAEDVTLDEHCYVYATIPANTDAACPVVGLIAHMDTSPAVSDTNVKPVITPGYAGGDIRMSEGYVLSPDEYPALLSYVGGEIICSDGTTLLGADDKAGVAEIMAAAKLLLSPDAPKHGKLRLAFTPDEEIGCGVDGFDVAAFGADVAYTVDGGALGEINYESFNAAGVKITIKGVSIHTGSARGKLVNAALLAMEFHNMLPPFMNPACTDGYEGFFHLDRMEAAVDHAEMHYLIRNHDRSKFEDMKRLFAAAAEYMRLKYGKDAFSAEISDTYYNMAEKIDQSLVERARAAFEQVGVTPFTEAIRGGTDGSRLSFMGLPTPNLSTGGHNFHGRYEFIPTESMETMVEVLSVLVSSFVA